MPAQRPRPWTPPHTRAHNRAITQSLLDNLSVIAHYPASTLSSALTLLPRLYNVPARIITNPSAQPCIPPVRRGPPPQRGVPVNPWVCDRQASANSWRKVKRETETYLWPCSTFSEVTRTGMRKQ